MSLERGLVFANIAVTLSIAGNRMEAWEPGSTTLFNIGLMDMLCNCYTGSDKTASSKLAVLSAFVDTFAYVDVGSRSK